MEYEEITGAIIGCAMQVHKTLGNGYQEIIYQRAMAIEMEQSNISFEIEKELSIYYRNIKIGSRHASFFVEDKIIVNIKAVSDLDNGHFSQILNCLEVNNSEVGLLINFGEPSLRFKRIHNNKVRRP